MGAWGKIEDFDLSSSLTPPGSGLRARSGVCGSCPNCVPLPSPPAPRDTRGCAGAQRRGLDCSLFSPAGVGRKAAPGAQLGHSNFADVQGRFLWGAWLGLRWGVGGVRSERIQEPGKEGQRLEPRAINHGFARGADGLASSVGPKWGKLGAWRRGVARPRPAAPWQERPLEEGMARRLPPEQQDEPPSEDEIKMLGTEGKFLQERSVRLCGDPKAGETESGGSTAASGGAITVLLSVAIGPALCCAPEAPAPSPAHCPCGSGRCLPTQHCGAGGAGRRRGDPDLALSWEEPCRAQAQSPGGA